VTEAAVGFEGDGLLVDAEGCDLTAKAQDRPRGRDGVGRPLDHGASRRISHDDVGFAYGGIEEYVVAAAPTQAKVLGAIVFIVTRAIAPHTYACRASVVLRARVVVVACEAVVEGALTAVLGVAEVEGARVVVVAVSQRISASAYTTDTKIADSAGVSVGAGVFGG